jgi:hypothetical protein
MLNCNYKQNKSLILFSNNSISNLAIEQVIHESFYSLRTGYVSTKDMLNFRNFDLESVFK